MIFDTKPLEKLFVSTLSLALKREIKDYGIQKHYIIYELKLHNRGSTKVENPVGKATVVY